MIYTISDLHGCYDLYEKLLRQIQLTKNDTLYILGDLVDRGDKPMEILLDIADRPNVIALCGNHDYVARIILSKYIPGKRKAFGKFGDDASVWLEDGGIKTYESFMKLSKEKQKRVIQVFKSQPIFEELELNGQKYFLSHSVPEKERFEEFDDCNIYDFIMGEPDYELVYDEKLTIITGHTPTSFIDEAYRGRFWKQNNHIAIDCGAYFNGVLGCLCLDTMEEIYVKV